MVPFRKLALLGLAMGLTAVPDLAQSPAGDLPAGVRDHPYTPEQERNLGRALLAAMEVNAPPIQAPALDQYLDATDGAARRGIPTTPIST